MRILLDTHALLWFLSGDDRLGEAAKARIAAPENEVLVSVASLWEIQVKVRVGKLEADLGEIVGALPGESLALLPITPAHLIALRHLPWHHKDPWDHLLIAQAMSEGAVLMSSDRHVPAYPVLFMGCAGAEAARLGGEPSAP